MRRCAPACLRKKFPGASQRGQQGLFGGATSDLSPTARVPATSALDASAKTAQVFRVPKRFLLLSRKVAAHRDPKKWRLLYSVLWRIEHENHNLLKVETDEEVIQLLRMEDAVSRDVHHMHAFVRFKKIVNETGERFVAWYKPDHKIVGLAAPFFVERFASMHWSLLTPDGSAHWNGAKLWFSEGIPVAPEDTSDGLEQLWSKYYATTFNPARTNTRMMRSEMPVRFGIACRSCSKCLRYSRTRPLVWRR